MSYGPDDDNLIIKNAVAEVTKYWVDEFPKLYPGQVYHPVDPSRLYPYGPNNPPPACGGSGVADYQTVAMNAFYCPPEDYVAWDHAALTPALLRDFGPLALGIVMAHELGHKVQNEHGILDGRFITFVTEQQADCFAGAWVKSVRGNSSPHFDASDTALDDALSGFLKIRDPIGTNVVSDSNAHGSAFQRINAFEDGLTTGPDKCKSYEAGDIRFVPETFNDTRDLLSNGNLPYDQLEPLVIKNLNGFWTAAFSLLGKTWTEPKVNAFNPSAGVTCAKTTVKDATGLYFYCPDNDTVNWDEGSLMPKVYQNAGDMAVAEIIATDYSQRAQSVLGLPNNITAGQLQTDCMTGVWTGMAKNGQLDSTLPPDAQLSLSPGDLDEVVAGFLKYNGGGLDQSRSSSTAFERINSFRSGFFEAFTNGLQSGLGACHVPK